MPIKVTLKSKLRTRNKQLKMALALLADQRQLAGQLLELVRQGTELRMIEAANHELDRRKFIESLDARFLESIGVK
jgi:hypothetical protein